jgi:hypothetical protein
LIELPLLLMENLRSVIVEEFRPSLYRKKLKDRVKRMEESSWLKGHA